MKNPIDAIIEWLVNTDLEYQEDIVFRVRGEISDSAPKVFPGSGEKAMQEFVSWIKTHDDGSYKAIDFAISFKAIIENFIISRRSTAEQWDILISAQEQLLQTEKIKKNDFVKDALETIPNQRDEWIEICTRWNEMASESLNEKNLNSWSKV